MYQPATSDDFSSESLKSLMLTRVGDFEFKVHSYLTDSRGNVVYGFMCVARRDDPRRETQAHHQLDQWSPSASPLGEE